LFEITADLVLHAYVPIAFTPSRWCVCHFATPANSFKKTAFSDELFKNYKFMKTKYYLKDKNISKFGIE